MSTKEPVQPEVLKRAMAKDSCIVASRFLVWISCAWGVMTALLPIVAGVRLWQFGVIGRLGMLSPLPLFASIVLLWILGKRRTVKRIEHRNEVCAGCGFDRAGRTPDEKCPECGITPEGYIISLVR
jgi:hypothetical protein